MTVLVAIDVGTSAVKAALVDDGGIVALHEVIHPLSSPAPGWVEQDPEQWWDATVAAVAALRADGDDHGVDWARVEALALTGQMQDLVALDGDGEHARALRPAILYSDGRAAIEHALLEAELGEGWHAATAARPDASNVAAKWRWLVANDGGAVAATRRVVFGAHSFVAVRLTGRVVCDPTTAATTGLYDIAAGDWWAPVVDAAGLTARLPEIHPADAVLAPLRPGAATALGLPAGLPVVHGPGDAIATTVGIVGTAPTPYAYLGTSGWTATATTTPVPAAGAVVLPGVDDRSWITVAPMLSAGSVLDWARAELLAGCSFDEFDRLASSVTAADAGLFFLPHLDGARAPVPLPPGSAAFIGVSRSTTSAQLAAAVCEGLAGVVRQQLAAVTAGAPAATPDAGRLVVCGGASRLGALRQAISDVTGRVVDAVSDVHATVRGAASAGRLALGAAPLTPLPSDVTVLPGPAAAIHQNWTGFVDHLVSTMSPALIGLGRHREQPGQARPDRR